MGKSTISMAIFYVANCNIFFQRVNTSSFSPWCSRCITIKNPDFFMVNPLFVDGDKTTMKSPGARRVVGRRCPATSPRRAARHRSWSHCGSCSCWRRRSSQISQFRRNAKLWEWVLYHFHDNHICIEMLPFWWLIDIYRYLSINSNNVQW